MYNINEIMICLDNTSMDEYLINYTNILSTVLNPRTIYFVHVAATTEPHQKILEELNIKKGQFFTNNAVETETDILYGDPVAELLAFAKDKDVELMVVGKKNQAKNHTTVTEILTQKAPCSITIVQERSEMKIDNILLPVDFSSYSKMAVEEAKAVSKKLSNARFCTLTLYDVPSGYYKWGKNYDEAAAIMKQNKEKYYYQYMKKINASDLPLEPYFKFKANSNDAEAIYNFALENNTNLIIIGARGKTKASLFLMGSTTNDLLKLNNKIPTMVLKKKNYQFDFLHALRKI